MDDQPVMEIESCVLALLQKHAKDSLPVKQIIAGLPVTVRRQLALTGAQSTTALVHKLTPYLGNAVQVYKGPRSTSLGRKMPLAEMILQRLRQQPGLSSRQLGRQLPVTKTSYLTALNELLQAGSIVCTVKADHTPCLTITEAHHPQPAVQYAEPANDREAFKAVYDQVGQGRGFVRLHRLRDSLQWRRERFDRVVQGLRAAYLVELHGGEVTAESQGRGKGATFMVRIPIWRQGSIKVPPRCGNVPEAVDLTS